MEIILQGERIEIGKKGKTKMTGRNEINRERERERQRQTDRQRFGWIDI